MAGDTSEAVDGHMSASARCRHKVAIREEFQFLPIHQDAVVLRFDVFRATRLLAYIRRRELPRCKKLVNISKKGDGIPPQTAFDITPGLMMPTETW